MNPFPFVAGSYASRSKKFDAQRTINLFPEASGSGNSKSIAMLIGTPGTVTWTTLSAGANRGMLRFSKAIAIVVTGDGVWKTGIDPIAVPPVQIGTVPDLGTPVSMASNGTQVMLVDGTSTFYVIDPVTGAFTPTTDPSYTGADKVDYIAGYFVFNKTGTQQYQITQLFSTVIDPLDFASAEGSPDLLVSLIVDHKEIWLLGETSTEVHFNSGNPDFPFEPIQGAFMEQGCAAKFSVAKITDGTGTGTVMFLTANEAGEGMVVRTVGYQLQRISDHAIEFAIQNYSRIDDAIGFTQQAEGHNFYWLTFPTANATWVYDTSTEMWHERAYRDPATFALGRHLANCYMFFAGKHLIGDYRTGGVYELDLDTYTDLGSTMLAIRQCPHLSAGDSWMVFDKLWIDMETGVGISASPGFPGIDPQLLLEWSDDGGYTFPNSRLVPIGKIGQRQVRAVARRLGKSKDRVFRATISDPVRRCFIDAGTNVHGGN